ncbi:MAG: hypothetical protein ACI4AQ_09630 [Lachnospiraceae bacterium]
MKFEYSDRLKEYIANNKKKNIVIEVVVCNNSEIEIAELHVYLIDDKRARYFKEKQGYGFVTTQVGEVLIPKFKLTYDEVVSFDLKKVLFFHMLTYKGVVLEK